jgi:LuxR family maltose regulon positive regulatory protein
VPLVRPGIVARELVVRLAGGPQLVTVVGPPGYGKTTLLAQWAAAEGREVAWVTLDEHDDDPAALLASLVAALSQALPGLDLARRRRNPSVLAVGRALAALPPSVLVLDEVQHVTSSLTVDVIGDLVRYLSPGSSLALCGRHQPVPLGRLRTELDVLELGVADLAFDLDEGRALLQAAGAVASESTVSALVTRTEGWPVALYLAALSLRAGADPELAGFDGDSRMVAEYLNAEVVAALPAELREFVTRTAVLDPLCGPLCDSVLQAPGGAGALEQLAARNLLVSPVGGTRQWYRYHPLLRDFLLADLLRTTAADEVAGLRQRASDWCAGVRLVEQALGYAADAGDDDRLGALMLAAAQPLWASGRAATAEVWLARLDERGYLAKHPALACLWGFLLALSGRATEAERWIDRAAAGESQERLPDGTATLSGWHHLVWALLCRQGPEQMLRNADDAIELLAPTSVFLATALCERGLAALMCGEERTAEEAFEDAAAAAVSSGAHAAGVIALAEMALLACDGGRWDVAAERVAAATTLVHAQGMESYATTAIAYAAAARVATHHRDEQGAERALLALARLRPVLTRAVPHLAVQARVVAARCHLARGEWDGGRTLLSAATEGLGRRPLLGRFAEDATELDKQLTSGRAGGSSAPTLTVAELRLLPYLPTHLSFRGIGERLFLSQHTIKTQALSIYRKLGVSSRADAVARAGELGLLAP